MATIDITQNNIQTLQWITLTPDPASTVIQNGLSAGATDIKNAIADDRLANTAGNTQAPPPDNYRMLDATVGVSLTTPGDVFKGTNNKDISTQFINLTPDTLQITTLSPNTFIKTDVGNDTISVTGGRNILSAGAGGNTLTGSTTGVDTFLSDVATGNVITAITNFHSGDNAAITGLSLADFHLTVKDIPGALEIDAVPLAPGKNAAQLILQGFATTDLNTKLAMGFASTGNTAQDTNFLFVHGV